MACAVFLMSVKSGSIWLKYIVRRCSMSGVAKKVLRLLDVLLVKVADLEGEFLFAGQGDVVELLVEVLLEDRQILVVHLAGQVPLAGEGEGEGGVHALGGFLHVLAGDDAGVILVQDGVDGAAKPEEEGDGVTADGDQKDEQRKQTDENAFSHGTKCCACGHARPGL